MNVFHFFIKQQNTIIY